MSASSSSSSGRPVPGRSSSSPRETASAILCSARKSSIGMASRAYRAAPTDATTFYPRLIGTHGAVAANSYLSVNAGVDVLKAGGNAIDAAVAASFVEGLVNAQMHTIGGECPILFGAGGSGKLVALKGNRAAPARGGGSGPPRRWYASAHS